MKKIVTISGGGGGMMLLSELKNNPVKISAIVNVVDDGGSSGILRKELGVFPPGDVRQCLFALSRKNNKLIESLNYRFEDGFLSGHSLGNLILSGLEKHSGDFNLAIKRLSALLDVAGEVIPVSLKPPKLIISFAGGDLLEGEHSINVSALSHRGGLQDIKIEDAVVNPQAVDAIMTADAVVIGPGNLFCSLLPCLAIKEISDAIQKTNAKIMYVVNLINKRGHTDDFTVTDYVKNITRFIGKRLDVVIANNQEILNEKWVRPTSQQENLNYRLILENLVSENKNQYSKKDALAQLRASYSHDNSKLVGLILNEI